MKKILSILLVSVLLIGCSKDRVLIDELTNKGTEESPIMYSEKGLFNGIGFDVYKDGQLKFENNYTDGKKDGSFKEWYENGQLSYEGNWKDGNKDGLWKKWYENGLLVKKEVNYKDGNIDGLWKEWYKNGQLSYEGNYKDGWEDGLQKNWFENGQLISESNYTNGVKID